jgi:predicted small secreted protein
MVRKYLGAALLLGTILVSACNTIEGAGRDVKSVGNTVEKAAK